MKYNPIENTALEQVSKPLLAWYDRERRILPWRENPKPYYVWLSEIMLQQTRVEAVKPYFDRFLEAVPDIGSLAQLDEEKLLKLWEGLGYYNRARNLQKTAKILTENFGGVMPRDYQLLLTLPGIGSYTAGAIASIAYGMTAPAVDGNVLRVLSRVRADDADILLQKTKKKAEQELMQVIPRERPGDFNQALMELGAMICTPNGTPKCGNCPLSHICMAHGMQKESAFPVKKVKKKRTIESFTILIVKDEGKTAFVKRPIKGLLAGLYGFPAWEGELSVEEVAEKLAGLGLKVLRIRPVEKAKHIFTHKEWLMTGYEIKVDELDHPRQKVKDQGWIFIDKEEAAQRFPIPSAYAAYRKYL